MAAVFAAVCRQPVFLDIFSLAPLPETYPLILRMSDFKKYIFRVVAFLLFFVAINAVVWKCWTEKLFSIHYRGGDLARMGYLPNSKLLRTNSFDLPLRHIEDTEYQGQPIRVMTIGDSFSNGGGGGKNRYYQDYIASINHCNVLNMEPYQSQNFLELVVTLLHNGYLDKVRPKYLIFSASEKFCIEKYTLGIDLTRNTDSRQLATLARMGYAATGKGPAVTFVNEGNFKFLLNSLFYQVSDRAYFSKTIVRELSAPFFTSKDQRKLLFYRDDITKIPLSTPQLVSLLNDNLNTVADLLRKKGIQFYFMPCVDKYNLYSDFIVEQSLPSQYLFRRIEEASETIYPDRYEGAFFFRN